MSVEVARVSAVVAREDDQRVLNEAEAIERFEYLTNGPVQVLYHVSVISSFTGSFETFVRPVRIPFLSTRTDMGLSQAWSR